MHITENGLSAADFNRFFQELWGYAPYDWQQKLAESVLQPPGGIWPQAIALPTAAGKTACIDIAIFALAALPHSRHPRRIFYAVDRRNIVDQTYARASDIKEKLAEAESGMLKTIADQLRRVAGDNGAQPLEVHRLRGGIRRSSGWERDPRQPAVITTTVDQIGSALLFRAYGKGPRVRPVHAGLTANDSIIILDEAHCSQPFLQTARAVRKFRQWAAAPLATPFQTVIMSATPPPETAGRDTFLDASPQLADPNHPLGKRQTARKPTTLIMTKRNAKMGQELAAAALELVQQGIPAVAIFANRVATAREAHRIIKDAETADAVLITGRMRQRERDQAMESLQGPAAPNPDDRAAGNRPLIAVATQTLEVGADLDFDGLVTECASLDALRQRFGRLNRAGRDTPAPGRIIIHPAQANAKNPDPIYGPAISAAWQWLNHHAGPAAEIDFATANINHLLTGAESPAELNAPTQHATVMLPSHIDAWAQTSPGTGPSPAPETYLHGKDNRPADVQICWRAGLNLDLDHRAELREILRICPPNSLETLPVPLHTFRQWLAGQTVDDTGDAPGNHASEPPIAEENRQTRRVIRWRGGESETNADPWRITANPRRISPGDTIIIPTGHPGNFHAIGDLPDYRQTGASSLDIGDETNRQTRGRPTLRISEELLAEWERHHETTTPDQVREAISEISQESITASERREKITELLELLSQAETPQHLQYLATNAESLMRPNIGFRPVSWSGNHLALQPRRPQQAAIEQIDDEDDVSHSRRARRISLEQHSRGVAQRAEQYAQSCRITGPELAAIRCAALLHDIGKADPLFQQAMHGGNPYYNEPLAKSPDATNPKVRHELMSVKMAESNPDLLPDDPEARELTLHLIASHHGHCRPFAPFRPEDLEKREAQFTLNGATMTGQGPTQLARMDSGVPQRYWNLTRKYGWWGLAYLEAIMRVADWSQSEIEEQEQ